MRIVLLFAYFIQRNLGKLIKIFFLLLNFTANFQNNFADALRNTAQVNYEDFSRILNEMKNAISDMRELPTGMKSDKPRPRFYKYYNS